MVTIKVPIQCYQFILDNLNNFEKKYPILPIEKFPFLARTRNTIMLQHLVIHFSLYLSNSRLWEVQNKEKIQTFSSKSGRGHLREVIAHKRFQIW